jgi:D-inositol-3-phosphate glycosyltransferase
VEVLGWAYCADDPIEAVVVLVDGEPRTLATLGIPRPDVAARFGYAPGSLHAGWTAILNQPSWNRTDFAIGALAVTVAGLVDRLDVLWVDASELRNAAEPAGAQGSIERPAPAARVPAAVVPVEGWALAPGLLARVELRVDGRSAGPARPLAVPRPDLAHLPLPTAVLAGFTHTVDLSEYRPGDQIRLDGDIVTARGARYQIPAVEVVVGAPPPDDPRSRVPILRSRVTEAGARQSRVTSPIVRLAAFTHQLDRGGGQLYLIELLRHLLGELDISCLVISQADGPLADELEQLGATVHVCGRYPASSPQQYEGLLLELTGLVRDHGCNVAIVNTMTAAAGADLCQRIGIPAIWAIHESYSLGDFWLAAYGTGGLHPYVKRQAIAALGSTPVVVFEADATRQLYQRYGPKENFITVPYGITTSDIDRYAAEHDPAELRDAACIPEDATVLLCMGMYEPRKSQSALVVAFSRVADEFPRAMLALVGDTGSGYAQAIHELVGRLGLDDRVVRVPVVSDTYAWYAIADALVSASDVESLPRSALEAMAFGRPVVGAAVYGLPELITDGVSGLLFPPRDIAALAEALRRFLNLTLEHRDAIGKAAARLVREGHDSALYAGVYRTLLRGLISEPGVSPRDLLAM